MKKLLFVPIFGRRKRRSTEEEEGEEKKLCTQVKA